MNNELFIDCFTGLPVKKEDIISWNGQHYMTMPSNLKISEYSYKLDVVGKVDITWDAFNKIKKQEFDSARRIIAGILRNLWELDMKFSFSWNARTFDEIDENFIDYKIYEEQFDYPKTIQEKTFHLLKWIYNKSEKGFKKIDIISSKDHPLIYGSKEEINDIIKYLRESNYVIVKRPAITKDDSQYYDLRITREGISYLGFDKNEKLSFTIGDTEVDKNILHALKLFSAESATIQDKRSACETLSYVMEPFRADMKLYLEEGDVNDFFNIVNNFNVRHNKPSTKRLEHEEQYDWLFNNLLSTIEFYFKMKKKSK